MMPESRGRPEIGFHSAFVGKQSGLGASRDGGDATNELTINCGDENAKQPAMADSGGNGGHCDGRGKPGRGAKEMRSRREQPCAANKMALVGMARDLAPDDLKAIR